MRVPTLWALTAGRCSKHCCTWMHACMRAQYLLDDAIGKIKTVKEMEEQIAGGTAGMGAQEARQLARELEHQGGQLRWVLGDAASVIATINFITEEVGRQAVSGARKGWWCGGGGAGPEGGVHNLTSWALMTPAAAIPHAGWRRSSASKEVDGRAFNHTLQRGNAAVCAASSALESHPCSVLCAALRCRSSWCAPSCCRRWCSAWPTRSTTFSR